MTSISFLAGAGRDRREIRCVGEENLTDGYTARMLTVAPDSGWRSTLGKMVRADDRIRIAPSAQEPMTARTELILVTGERYCIDGDPKDVERTILDAARGSLMQLAWLVEAETEQELGVNPDHVVTLRAADG